MLSMEAKLNEFVHRLKEAASSNLESVILYGSAARGDFHPEHSDLNLLCVLRSLAVEELARVAPVVHWWSGEQKEPPPLFFTNEELVQSADVFSIEMRDMQDSRKVLFGSDPIAAIPVPTNLHRVQVEHELRTVVLKLRSAYFRAPNDEHALTPVLRKSFSGVLVLLRHVIIAFGSEPPSAARDIIERAAVLTQSNAAAFENIMRLREQNDAYGVHLDIAHIYGAYLVALENVVSALHKHLPKSEWQRTKQAHS